MEKMIAACLLALAFSFSQADDLREEVKVVASEPPRASYGFQAPGRSPVSCLGTGCARYYAPSASNAGAAVLRLMRTDASIAIVQCKAPQCMMPDPSYKVAAEFTALEVKLTMFKSSADGPGPITSETYSIVGVLRPTPGQQAAILAPPASSATQADAPTTQQPQPNPDTTPASAAASAQAAASQPEKPQGRRIHRVTAADLQSSPELLTYLTHELLDPNSDEAKKRLAELGPVQPSLAPQTLVSPPLQQEPQGITPPPDQAPLQQGAVDTAVTPPAAASTIALSAPTAVPPAPTKAPLAQGPVDTALAPAPAASTIALSAPKAIPPAAPKTPISQGPVDAALTPPAAPSTAAKPAPAPAPMPPVPAPAPPVTAQVSAPPARTQAPPPAQAPLPTPAASQPTQVAAAPAPPTPAPPVVRQPATTPPAATAPPPANPAPPTPAPTNPIPAPPAHAPSSPVPPVSVASAPLPPPAAGVFPKSAQSAPRAPAPVAQQAQITPQSKQTSAQSIQMAAASTAAPMPGIAPATISPESKPAASPAAAPGDAAPAVSYSFVANPRLRRVEVKIADVDSAVDELATQWAMFEKECPEPTTDSMCLDAKTKVIASTMTVFQSKIPLLEQKIAILDTTPDNTIAQQEKDEAKDTLAKMKVALDSFPKVLAHLNKVLEDLKHANDEP